MLEREPSYTPAEKPAEKEQRPKVKELLLDKLSKSKVLRGFALAIATAPMFWASKAFAGETTTTEPAPPTTAEVAQKEILKSDADRIALIEQMVREFIPSKVTVETLEDGTTQEKVDTKIDPTKTLGETMEITETEKTYQERLDETVGEFQADLENLGISEEQSNEVMKKLAFDAQTLDKEEVGPQTLWGKLQQVLANLLRITRKGAPKLELTEAQTDGLVKEETETVVDLAKISVEMQINPEQPSETAPESKTEK